MICLVKPWFLQDQHLGSNPFLFSLATTCSGHRSNLKGSVWPSDLHQWGKVTKHHYVIKICYPPTSLSFCGVLVEYHLFLDCHPEPPHNQCIHVNQEWQYQEGRSSWRCQSLGFRKGTHGEVAEPWSGEGLGFGLVFRQSFRYILIPILDDARYDHTGIPFHMHPTKLKSRQIIFLPKTFLLPYDGVPHELHYEQVTEEEITLTLTSVADAAAALGDLTKSSPKRKSGGADAKSKPKAAKKAKK